MFFSLFGVLNTSEDRGPTVPQGRQCLLPSSPIPAVLAEAKSLPQLLPQHREGVQTTNYILSLLAPSQACAAGSKWPQEGRLLKGCWVQGPLVYMLPCYHRYLFSGL